MGSLKPEKQAFRLSQTTKQEPVLKPRPSNESSHYTANSKTLTWENMCSLNSTSLTKSKSSTKPPKLPENPLLDHRTETPKGAPTTEFHPPLQEIALTTATNRTL